MHLQEHLPHQWVPPGRADLTFGKTAICIIVAKFNDRLPFLSPTQTLLTVQERRLYPTDLALAP